MPTNTGSIFELENLLSIAYSASGHAAWAQFLEEWQHIFYSLLTIVLVSLTFVLAARQRASIPSGIQNFFEWFVEVAEVQLGQILGEDINKYLPLLGTLFLYIFAMNFLGIFPLLNSPTTNLNVTIGLAIVVFVFVQFSTFKNRGVIGYMYHLAGEPQSTAGWILAPIVFCIDLLNQFTRPLTLAFRLFGNMFGEEILIGYFTLLGLAAVSIGSYFISIPAQLPFMLLSPFISLLQAMVFTFLSAVYILLSLSETEESTTKH